MAEKVQRKTPKAPRKRQWHRPRQNREALRVEQPRVRQDVLDANEECHDIGAPQSRDIAAPASPRTSCRSSIGGVVARLELAGAQPTFIDQVRARYSAFEMPAAPWVQDDISLRLHLILGAAARHAGWLAASAGAPADRHGDRARDRRRALGSAVKLAPVRGERGLASYRGSGRCEINPMSIDCLLRVLHATLLPAGGRDVGSQLRSAPR